MKYWFLFIKKVLSSYANTKTYFHGMGKKPIVSSRYVHAPSKMFRHKQKCNK